MHELQRQLEWEREVEKEKAIEKKNRALGMVGTEYKTKYPKGSYIMFEGSRMKEEELKTVSCSWYDKVGGPKPYKHIISAPPEWQNIPIEKADEIAELFDEHFLWVWEYHKPVESEKEKAKSVN